MTPLVSAGTARRKRVKLRGPPRRARTPLATTGAWMDWLVWGGALVTLAGFAGIVYSIVAVVRARRAGLDDAALRARLNGILPVNIGALLLSMLGLMAVVVGVILG